MSTPQVATRVSFSSSSPAKIRDTSDVDTAGFPVRACRAHTGGGQQDNIGGWDAEGRREGGREEEGVGGVAPPRSRRNTLGTLPPLAGASSTCMRKGTKNGESGHTPPRPTPPPSQRFCLLEASPGVCHVVGCACCDPRPVVACCACRSLASFAPSTSMYPHPSSFGSTRDSACWLDQPSDCDAFM